MKITFVMWGTDRTGGTNAIFQVADRLALAGHTVTVVSAGLMKHQWFSFKSSIKFRYPEEVLPKIRRKRVIEPILQLVQGILRKYTPGIVLSKHLMLTLNIPEDSDVVIATYYETAFCVQMFPSVEAKKFYYIQHFEPVFFQDPIQKQRVIQTYFFPLKWIVSSTWAKNRLLESIGKEGRVVIPGSDLDTYRPHEKTTDDKVRRIVSLGKSMPIKGLNYLLDALDEVIKVVPNIMLVLYGSEPSVKAKSRVPTEYVFKPTDEELADIYSNADVVVTPSLFESSPSPPIEAMACGAPLVTTQYGTEDYCFNNVNCLVVAPMDSNSLADAVLKLLLDPELCQRLRSEAFKTVKNLNWENTAREFFNAISS